MGFLSAGNLAKQILHDRFDKEAVARPHHNGQKPRQHQQCEPGDTGERPQRQEPAGGAVDDN